MKKIIFVVHTIITLAFTFMPLLFSWWINALVYSLGNSYYYIWPMYPD